MTSTEEPVLIARIEGRLGHLTLNRPKRINALSVELVDALNAQLAAYAADDAVELVLLDGAGDRGLCAGGDIKALYSGIRGGEGDDRFFVGEYMMNAAIAHYPKPYVAIMDGITMGGGIGVAGHGDVRIVTERSQLAMPETAIGLFPDVGALFLLARCPGELGTHMALTGARLDAARSIHAGLADHYLPTADVPGLIERLTTHGTEALAGLDWPAVPSDAVDEAVADQEWIDACYPGDDIDAILARLDTRPEPGAAAAAATIRSASPTSVKVTLAALRRAADLTVDEVLAQDLTLVRNFLRHPDLAEGIRAQVIDKDRQPQWNPASLDAVSEADVQAFFS